MPTPPKAQKRTNPPPLSNVLSSLRFLMDECMDKTIIPFQPTYRKANSLCLRSTMVSSPPFLPFFLLLFPLLISATPPPPAVPPWNRRPGTQAEIDALTAFRVALHDPLGALAGWDPSSPSAPCSWRGVLCSPSSSPPPVVELRLPRLRLSGPISDRLAAGLPFLQKLSLRQNSFSGPIPASLSRLSRLRSLFLQFNSLTGPLPPSLLTNLSDLQVFSAAGNLLTGGVPTALPGSIRFLDLSSNALAGPLPDNLSAAAPRLQLLNLSFNRLRGTLPPSLAHLRSLLYLWLDWNRLEGPIPAVLANCSSLLHLGLQGNDLQGILPAALPVMRSLQVLSLSHNRLSGPLPSSLFSNSSLRIAQLADNAFTSLSQPPPANTSSSLQVVDLKANRLAGPFPEWLADVSGLTVLDLSSNAFSGALLLVIGWLSMLEELRVRGNSMAGPIPSDIA